MYCVCQVNKRKVCLNESCIPNLAPYIARDVFRWEADAINKLKHDFTVRVLQLAI